MAEEKEVGKVAHFYGDISVAVVNVTGAIKLGDKIHIKGATTDFTQEVTSMQIEHKNIKEAKKGNSVGLKVVDLVRKEDTVYKV